MVGALACAWPWYCRAQFGSGGLHFNHGGLFLFAALVALPTSAVMTFVIEAIAPRRRMPAWLSITAGVFATIALTLAVAGVAPHSPAEKFVVLWFVVPPLATLALRGAVPTPLTRLGAGWSIALAAFGLAMWRKADADMLVVLAGGAVSCLLLWSATVLILWARGATPPAAAARTQRSELRSAIAAVTPAAAALRGAVNPLLNRIEQVLQPAETGLSWWLGAALVLYFGIGAAIAQGKLGGGAWLYGELQWLIDLFALPPLRIADIKQLWWFVGLPWSLVAGSAVWGLAGLFGLFNPGRARAARFAGIVFGGALLAWTALMIIQTQEIQAREERASGIRR